MNFAWWLFFALAAPFLWAINNVTDRLLITRFVKNEFTLTFATGMLRLGYFFLLWMISGFYWPEVFLMVLALLVGMFVNLAFIFYFKALRKNEAMLVILLYDATNPLFVLFLSMLFLHEQLTGSQNIGFFFLLLGGILSAVKFGSRFAVRPGIFMILIATIFWGVADVLLGYILPRFPDVMATLAWTSLGGFFSSFFLLLSREGREACRFQNFRWPKAGWALFLVPAPLSLAAFIFFFRAIQLGGVSLTSVATNVQALFIFLLDTTFFFGVQGWLPEKWRIFEPVDLSWNALVPKGLAFFSVMAGMWFLRFS